MLINIYCVYLCVAAFQSLFPDIFSCFSFFLGNAQNRLNGMHRQQVHVTKHGNALFFLAAKHIRINIKRQSSEVMYLDLAMCK